MRYEFDVWWACRDNPFFVAKQFIAIYGWSEFDALARVLATPPRGPFLQQGCCYISQWAMR